MTNAYAWSGDPDLTRFESPTPSALAADIRSVGELWVSTAYDDLRRAGPDRATQVRWILKRYIVPWFGPQTSTVNDVTYFMVHAWLMRLAGRPGIDAVGQAGERAGTLQPAGLSQSVIADALWTLRGVLGFARATGIVPRGFDPTEGLVAPAPDPATARSKPPASQPRRLTLPECARIETHLHPVHQLALWLQRVMGCGSRRRSACLWTMSSTTATPACCWCAGREVESSACVNRMGAGSSCWTCAFGEGR